MVQSNQTGYSSIEKYLISFYIYSCALKCHLAYSYLSSIFQDNSGVSSFWVPYLSLLRTGIRCHFPIHCSTKECSIITSHQEALMSDCSSGRKKKKSFYLIIPISRIFIHWAMWDYHALKHRKIYLMHSFLPVLKISLFLSLYAKWNLERPSSWAPSRKLSSTPWSGMSF